MLLLSFIKRKDNANENIYFELWVILNYEKHIRRNNFWVVFSFPRHWGMFIPEAHIVILMASLHAHQRIPVVAGDMMLLHLGSVIKASDQSNLLKKIERNILLWLKIKKIQCSLKVYIRNTYTKNKKIPIWKYISDTPNVIWSTSSK